MLSKNSMVSAAVPAAVKLLFTDVCTVFVNEKIEGAGGAARFSRRVLFENIPCRVSFDSISSAKSNGSMERTRFTRKNLIPAAEISSAVRLFVEAEYDIPPGSEIHVLRRGGLLRFCASGYAAVYSSHREIMVVPVEKFV